MLHVKVDCLNLSVEQKCYLYHQYVFFSSYYTMEKLYLKTKPLFDPLHDFIIKLITHFP